MKNPIVMELYSENEVTPDSARDQIEALSGFAGGIFRPDKCDTAEPQREIFDPENIGEPIRWLSQRGAEFKFRKSRPLRLEGYIANRHFAQTWTRETKDGPLIPRAPRFPEPHFLTSWVIWLDWAVVRKVGAGVLKDFASQMFKVSKSEYGFMTPESDHKEKNFLVTQLPGGSISSKFVGTDPEHGIPGLYWLNLFGPKFAAWLSPQIEAIPGQVGFGEDAGMLLQFGESPEDAQKDEVAIQQQRAIKDMGREKFFDISQPERRLASLFIHQ